MVGVLISATFNGRVVQNVLFLVNNWLVGRTIRGSNMPGLMRNDKSDSAWFVILMAKQDDRSPFNDPCNALEAWDWEHVEWDNRNASHPKISSNVVQGHRQPRPLNLISPSQTISWEDSYRGCRISETTNYCGSNP
jgi:hypothetical protein